MSKVQNFEELQTLFSKTQEVEIIDSEGSKHSFELAPLPMTKFADLLRTQTLLADNMETRDVPNPKYDKEKGGVQKDYKGKEILKILEVPGFKATAPKELYDLLQDLIVYAMAYSMTPKDQRDKPEVVKENEKKVAMVSVTIGIPLMMKILKSNNIGDKKDPQELHQSDSDTSVPATQKS